VVGTLRTYRALLRDRTFVGLMLVAGLAMAAIFAYVSGSSFVFQEQYGLDEQEFGLAFGAGAIGLIGSTQLNPVLLRRWQPQQLLVSALVIGVPARRSCWRPPDRRRRAARAGAPAVGGARRRGPGDAAHPGPGAVASRRGRRTAAALLGATQFGVAAVIAPLVGPARQRRPGDVRGRRRDDGGRAGRPDAGRPPRPLLIDDAAHR
jgi:DHA1 family bicyclomycin/chloramphenicol resistance-like MFS transporter